VFRPIPMARIGVIVRDDQSTQLTRLLAAEGVLQIESPSAQLGLDTATARSSISRWEALERQVTELAQNLEIPLSSARSPFEVGVDPKDDLEPCEKRVAEILSQAEQIRGDLATIAMKRRRTLGQIEELLLLSPVNWTLEELRSTQQLAVHIGVLSEVNVRRVEAILGALPHTTVRLPGPATGWDVVIVFSQKTTAEQVERALSSANFKPLEIPADLTGKPGEAEEKLWKLLDELEEQRKRLTQQLRETTTAEMGELCEIWEKARAARTLLAAQQPFGKTRSLSYVTGWVPKESSQALTQRIRDTIGAAAYVEVRDPEPHDPAVPVRLKNPSVFRPFEEVVTTYSLPSSKEIDPTVVVAITYLIMFGMMFGDVGQGLVLAAAGFWAAKKVPSVRNLGLILGMCGISSVIFGFVYGSVFGVEMQLNPWINLPLVEHHTSVMASNLAVLGGISIGFGIIMLSLGIIFNIVNAVREKEWGVAVFDQYGLTGLAFYWCALIWAVLTAMGFVGVGITALAAGALVALAVLFVREPIIRATERKEHLVEGGVGFFVVQALIDTMDMVIRFLSNTVSFIRVAAFGLTHAALFMAIHTIGYMISGSTHGAGYIVTFIVGNIFVVVMEGLIVSIQCLRLQYYEVFGKFYRGGGLPFAPLRAS